MGNKDFVFEIGCEEIPARFVDDAIGQLKQNTIKWFQSHRILFSEVHSYATPRRLAIVVNGVSESQEDVKEEIKGPALRIAKMPDGSWSRAAEGFAGKLGISMDQLCTKEIKGESYVVAEVHQSGRKTVDVMSETLHEVLGSIQFPKTMRWNQDTRFIRPVRWLLCVLGGGVVPVEWAGVHSGAWTYGHRFLGARVVISSADQYVDTLRDEYVIVDQKDRERSIVDQLHQIEQKHRWTIPMDADLLTEVTYLVEYPTALIGDFSTEFLSIPREVLITTMREHQRYFPVFDENGELLPRFIAVRNGNDRSLKQIIKGNEKVLRARFSDSRFFYEEDLKQPIEAANEKLSRILFMKNAGSMADKARRVEQIAISIADEMGVTEDELTAVKRAAKISKFALSTQMVNEFPELEGVMAREYARKANEIDEVANALFEYHFPRFSGDALPRGTVGTIVALADKMDTIVCSFKQGIKPTSSQDPYGLRRKAAGIVRILMHSPKISLKGLIRRALDEVASAVTGNEILEQDVYSFFEPRIRTILQEESIRYDIIDAVVSAGVEDPYWVLAKAKRLMVQGDDDSFKKEVEAFSRLSNLANKAGDTKFNRILLSESPEHALLRVFEEAKTKYEIAKENDHSLGMYQALTHMVPEINQFFERVMVMVEDIDIRNNRLALLREIAQFINVFASFEKVVFVSSP